MANGKTVDVRIIDRGPFVQGRIIDLSHAAAKEIELIGPGVGQVELTILAAPANPEPALFAVRWAHSGRRRMPTAWRTHEGGLWGGEGGAAVRRSAMRRILAGRETRRIQPRRWRDGFGRNRGCLRRLWCG